MNRETGYYWIQETPYHNWCAAFFHSDLDEWWFSGKRIYNIHEYNKINETRILNPDEK